jgi:hypothetical protein
MDKHSEEVQTKNTVKFTAFPDGRIEFEGSGTDEWALNDAINQVRQVANDRSAHKKAIKEVSVSSELASHAIFICFIGFISFACFFSLSRVFGTQFNFNQVQPGLQPTGAATNVK